MLKICLKCGYVNSQPTGDQMEACPGCGAIYIKVARAMLQQQAQAGTTAPSQPQPTPDSKLEIKKTAGNTTISTRAGFLVIASFTALVIVIGTDGVEHDASSSAGADKARETTAFIQCKNFVRDRLLAPASADFPFLEHAFWDMGNSTWVIKSHVDSQSGFGAMIRSSWYCKVQYVGGNVSDQRSWRLLDLEILQIPKEGR